MDESNRRYGEWIYFFKRTSPLSAKLAVTGSRDLKPVD